MSAQCRHILRPSNWPLTLWAEKWHKRTPVRPLFLSRGTFTTISVSRRLFVFELKALTGRTDRQTDGRTSKNRNTDYEEDGRIYTGTTRGTKPQREISRGTTDVILKRKGEGTTGRWMTSFTGFPWRHQKPGDERRVKFARRDGWCQWRHTLLLLQLMMMMVMMMRHRNNNYC